MLFTKALQLSRSSRSRAIDRSIGLRTLLSTRTVHHPLQKGRVPLVANSSGESMLSKGIATHSEAVIQPACIESVLVRHPRGFSLLRSTSRVSHRVCAITHTHAYTNVYIFGVVRASCHREGICEPWYQTLMQRVGVSEAVLHATPNDRQPPSCRTSLYQRFVSVNEQRTNPRRSPFANDTSLTSSNFKFYYTVLLFTFATDWYRKRRLWKKNYEKKKESSWSIESN